MNRSQRSACDADGRRKYLSKSEGKNFLNEAVQLQKQRALFCLTLYYTGCRISEALNLEGRHLDATANTALIRSLKKRSKKEVRRVPIPEFLIEGLLAIAPNDEGCRIWQFSRSTAWRMIKRVMRQAGISGIHATAKGLRHGFGVRGALGQIPINLIQNWMGHADVTTTIIYLEVKGEEERELIGRTWK